jgi:uncharacterized protein (TIGR02145 family)
VKTRLLLLMTEIAILMIIFTSCNKDESGIVTDIDGNVYHPIHIGNQTWMVENLKVTRYRNGDSILQVTGFTEWDNSSSGAWCDMNNEASNGDKYGHLYNWHTIADKRGLCPQGWHVPDDYEWSALVDLLGGEQLAGGKLKSIDTTCWKAPNSGACDLVGFSGLPGGARWQEGLFLYSGYYGLWWTSTEYNSDFAFYRTLVYDKPACFRNYYNKSNGCSLRCIKD